MAGLDDEPRRAGPRRGRRGDHRRDPRPAARAARGDPLVDPAAGAELGVGDATVARAWRRYHVQPWRRETFKFSTDPALEAKVRDVVGLYLDPPEKAIVLCVDEKSQIQALDRTAPILPLRPGLPERATHDYKRNGTTTLFAALEVATGRVTDRCYDRHGKAEFLDFLKQVARAYPRRELHVVLDNYHTHKHADVEAWLAKHPRVTLHFTPTSGSWLNLVEVFFGIITRQAIRRGSFASVPELVAAIGPSSTAGTSAATHSPGPRRPTRSCRTPANGIQTRDTWRGPDLRPDDRGGRQGRGLRRADYASGLQDPGFQTLLRMAPAELISAVAAGLGWACKQAVLNLIHPH